MIKFPFMTMQQLNLDWILQQLKTILKFMPINSGAAGDVLQRTVDGASWMPIEAVSMDIHNLDSAADIDSLDELPMYDVSSQGNFKITVGDLLDEAPVTSVNGQTGDVVLPIPAVPVDSVNGQTGTVVLDASDVGALPDTYTAPVTSVNGQTGAVVISTGGAVDSVNGQTGTVVLDASDVGALPDTYVAPVTSVNGQTGAVVISSGSSPVLLWTNSNLLSSFASQTVPLDLTGYSFIIIEYGVNEVGLILTAMFPVPTLPPPAGYSSYNSLEGWYITGANGRMSQRSLQITTSGVMFSGGVRFDAYNSSNTSDDTRCLPYRIWGIV